MFIKNTKATCVPGEVPRAARITGPCSPQGRRASAVGGMALSLERRLWRLISLRVQVLLLSREVMKLCPKD